MCGTTKRRLAALTLVGAALLSACSRNDGGANAPAPAPAGEPDTATPLRAARGLVDLVA